MADPKLYEVEEEIFAEGIWNGMSFDVKDFEAIVSSFNDLFDVHQVPLKMGHNEDQPMTDGQPSLGWVDKLWVEGKKLMGKFVDVPEIVYEAMRQKKYRNKSIELDFDVSYKGNKYQHVLSGVALLGADIPAVNTLNDLSYYLASRRASYAAANSMSFTTNTDEEIEMSDIDKLMAKVEKLEATIETLTSENKELSEANAKFSRQVEDFGKKDAERIKSEEKAQFDRDVESFKSDIEKCVEDKYMTPAIRDEIIDGINDADSLKQAKFSLDMFKKNSKPVIDNTAQGFHRSDNEDEKGKSPDVIIADRISNLQIENPKLSFAAAKKTVLEQDEDLARAYINMTSA